jgi:hypothetical protein
MLLGRFDLGDLKNTEGVNSLVIVGSAPSLAKVEVHGSKTGLFLGDSFLRTAHRFERNFLIRANSEFPSLLDVDHIRKVRELGAINFFAATVLESKRQLSDLLDVADVGPTYLFDQRHFAGKKCKPAAPCCEVIRQIEGIGTLQEFVAREAGLQFHYSSGDTVALHALALTTFLGNGDVHLVGIELPFFDTDYVYPEEVGSSSASTQAVADKPSPLTRLTKVFRSQGVFLGSRAIARQFFNRRLVGLVTGREVSIFAQDFPRIFSDFQYLVGILKDQNRKVYFCSSKSNLKHLNGISICPHLGEH